MNKIAKKLGEIPTMCYILTYLLLVFIFANIYYFLPDRSFYHSTSKYEFSELNEDALAILSRIKGCIVRNNRTIYGDSIINIQGWEMNINQLNVHSLDIADFPKDIGFKMSLSIKHQDGSMTSLSPSIRISTKEKLISDSSVFCFITYNYKPIEINDSINIPEINVFFRAPRDHGLQIAVPILIIPLDLWNKIIYFGQSYRGFPNRKVSGQWFRMLYLSSGIATSTLIGDIQPITKVSRFFITLQGILTLIIISLFFNALAYDISSTFNKSNIKKFRVKKGSVKKSPTIKNLNNKTENKNED